MSDDDDSVSPSNEGLPVGTPSQSPTEGLDEETGWHGRATGDPLPLAEIRNVVVDAFDAAVENHRGDGQDDSLRQVRTCYARLRLFELILLAIQDSALMQTLMAGGAVDEATAKAQIAYAAKIMTPMVLAECGVPTLADLIDRQSAFDAPEESEALNPLDLNDLTTLCGRDDVAPAAVRTLFILLGNLLMACLNPNRALNAEIVEFWGEEDGNLTSLYARLADPVGLDLAAVIEAAAEVRRTIG